ncbi:hypothetical protein U1Q18_021712 [Sarracenia purpurea var. burkii]
MTEDDAFDAQMNMGNRNSMLDGMFSCMTSFSPVQSDTALHQNNQKQIMAEFPLFSVLEGEPMNSFYTDLNFNISNHAGLLDCDASIPSNVPLGRNTISNRSCPNSQIQVQEERLLGGMSISSSPSQCPLEILSTSVSNNYSEALNSSFAISMNCGYDGILGGLNSKWDPDKFLACPELAGEITGRTTGFHSFQLMGNISPDGWILSENSNENPNNSSGSSKFSNELSLSLATCQPSMIRGTSIQDQCSEISRSGVSYCSLKEKQLGSETSCNKNNISLSFSSCRPVQLPQLLSGSRYLHAIQEIFAEIANYSLENLVWMNYQPNGTWAGGKIYAAVCSDDFANGDSRFDDQMDLVLQCQEIEAKKKRLLALLQLVDDRYSQCLDEIHTVISAFHAATELDPRIHACFALQTVSSLYKKLRERISSQILKMGSYFNKGANTREEDRSFEVDFIRKQWALQQLQRKDHQLWRPQRGLPERSVSVLRAWMFQNFLHPYPKDAEKQLLAVKSGLTRSQVSNWFINARVRLWKPMIEEMYTEMNRKKSRRNGEQNDSNRRSHHISVKSQRINIMN